MDTGAFGARLASAVVAPLVKKLFVQDGPGAELVENPVRISGLVSFMGEKRTLGRPEVRKLANELVERALRAAGPGERPLAAGEEHAVADALAHSLLVLGDLAMEDVQAVRLGHREFARVLRDGDPHAARDLSADGERLYDTLLETACLHTLHFFTQRSTFVARSLVEQVRLLEAIIKRLDLLTERVPHQSAQDAQFERRYAEFIAKRYSTLTIYGIDLHQAREWPLDTAYLSLEAVGKERYADADLPEGAVRPTTAPQPAERALAGHERVLLRGVAGSGKTTLMQWLAVTTARQDPVEGMTHLLGRVPFVLPLRTLTRSGAELPVPEGFLAATGCPIAGSQPMGWADRVLDAGRGLLLVDGVDEVPENERDRTRIWLRDLLEVFSGSLCLVTSRPSAIREDWLGRHDFTELTLSPMGRGEVTAFVQRWHAAAAAEPGLEESLLGAVRSKQDLARLATNPLMCGLICALHRERRGFLPRGRKALYDAALSMLLERRDRERSMHRPGGIELDEESQTELLQKLAYWLIRNGRAEMDQTDAVELLARLLPSMPYASKQGSPSEIFRHLLDRSGLLREPATGTVDFIHRTFQDYLGAREAVEERDFDLLVHNAYLDQWEDVIRMAVAHARPDERARLLRMLLDRGGKGKEIRRSSLLAMACLEHAVKLDPQVREAVEQRAATLIPPRSMDEAKVLADVGHMVLELLPGPEGLSPAEALSVVHTAAQVGTDAALPTLIRFRDHYMDSVMSQLGGHWDRFDTETYARDIVAHITDRSSAFVTVRSLDELAALEGLGGAVSTAIHGDFGVQEIARVLRSDLTVEFRLARNSLVLDLHFLSELGKLKQVELLDMRGINDLSPLGDAPVESLSLTNLTGLWGLRGLDRFTRLEQLVVTRSVDWPGLEVLPREAPIRRLSLPHAVTGLAGIEEFPRLAQLGLWECVYGLRKSDWVAIARHPGLRELNLLAADLVDLKEARLFLGRITGLYLLAEQEECPVWWLPELFPNLEHLAINEADEVDLAPLAHVPSLRSVSVSARSVENAAQLGDVEFTYRRVRRSTYRTSRRRAPRRDGIVG